ncbi:hypothetical protein HJC23_003475 [Cyclotella cryptica]|uniref:NADP-dependent oxidoreductase domain-containing protein n=1 Tax=Cyclotella cryptica TaxID=29204 RepID=A0ABD3QS41_9STRA
MSSMTATLSILLSLTSILSSHSHSLSDRPTLKYGTAWKKDATSGLVYRAILSGFRHIDTACQPRHYNEAGVGEGWSKAAYVDIVSHVFLLTFSYMCYTIFEFLCYSNQSKELGLSRQDIWIQTKFSGLDAHDPNNVPYDVNAPLEERVRQSLQKSLDNLQTDYLDSWVMHGPENNWDDHFKVWRTMEESVDEGKVKQLGISNFYRLEDVKWAYDNARIKPKVVQNRFYSESGHDVDIRRFCKENDIEYQSFWTLGANRGAYQHEAALEIADKYNVSPEGLFYAFCMAIGITPLDGTTSEIHMREDIELLERLRSGERFFESDEELAVIGDALGTPSWRADVDLEEEL